MLWIPCDGAIFAGAGANLRLPLGSSFRHANLLELLGFSCDGAHNCLVFSYMSNGSLQDRLACKVRPRQNSIRT